MKQVQDDILKFMLTAGQDCPETPTLSTIEVRKLRATLILEEAYEQCNALGFLVSGTKLYEAPAPNLVEIADGITDQIYVSVGTAIALGIDMVPIWDLVQSANMAKFGPGSWKREDGKQMKPPGWTPPDEAIKQEIKNQSRRLTEVNPLDQLSAINL